jgi:hypothetical protein
MKQSGPDGFAHGGELNAEHAKEKQLPNRSYRTFD